jgi:hypothetical protein
MYRSLFVILRTHLKHIKVKINLRCRKHLSRILLHYVDARLFETTVPLSETLTAFLDLTLECRGSYNLDQQTNFHRQFVS